MSRDPLDCLANFHCDSAAPHPEPVEGEPAEPRLDRPPLDHVPVSYREPEGSIYGAVEKILIGSIILLAICGFAAGYSWGLEAGLRTGPVDQSPAETAGTLRSGGDPAGRRPI